MFFINSLIWCKPQAAFFFNPLFSHCPGIDKIAPKLGFPLNGLRTFDKLLRRNKKIFSDTSDMLKALVVIKTQEERLVELEKYTLNGNPDLLREFFNRPDAFKESFKNDKGNEASKDIKSFVSDNYFGIHSVAKNIVQEEWTFPLLPTVIINHLITFIDGDIDLTPVGQEADYECKDGGY